MFQATRLTLCLLLITAILPVVGRSQEPKPPELTPEEQQLARQAVTLSGEAVRAYQAGRFPDAVDKLRQALAILQKLYPESKYPGGHPDLATTLNNLADVLDASGQADEALPYYKQGLEVYRKLFPDTRYPDGHPKLALNLNQMGFVLQKMGQAEPALTYFLQSLEMNRKLYPASKYPDGHFYLANSLNNVGYTLQLMGHLEEALSYTQQNLEMKRKLFPASRFPDGHAQLVLAFNNMFAVLESMGQLEQALTYSQQSLEMTRKLFPASKYADGHALLAQCLNNQGAALRAMGRSEQALTYYRHSLEMMQKLYPAAEYPDGYPDLALALHNLSAELQATGQAEQALNYSKQSLEMKRKLYPTEQYPNGHPDLALGLINLGGVLKEMAQGEQALPYYRQALDMYRKLYPAAKYPDGHIDIALSRNNLGAALAAMGRGEEALPYYQQSLEMFRRLFPASKYADGHRYIAVNLNNLGELLEDLGRAEEARSHYEQSLEMARTLYPATKYADGHPQFAIALLHLSGVLERMGQGRQALAYTQESVEMHQRLLRRELATASEEAAFDLVKDQPLYLDNYLNLTRSAQAPAERSLAVVWPSRSMVTRLLEQRQASSRAAGTELGAKLDELRGFRRRIEQLLQDERLKAETRDKLLAETTEKRDKLERELIAAIPTIQRWQQLEKLGPADLLEAMPARAVFIDVIRYTQVEYVARKQRQTPRYVAFVLAKPPVADAPGSPMIVRIDFEEPASAIDKAVATWRSAIEQGAASPSAQWLRAHVWSRLASAIPPGTKTIYLAPDGDLARLPWAALPIHADRVLLEEFALAQVPHGLFLLDQLKSGRKPVGPEPLLALGGVDYGAGKWPALPGTVAEIDALAKLSPMAPMLLGKSDATPEKLKDQLPTARYVHLATHGEFNADALTAERKRAEDALKRRLLDDDTRQVAAKNPLGYVGLVLANGEILSGLGIVDLNLENLKLVTLSACETGLGEYTGGEGVQGLQRAFHLAGCPNVVASLWKVNDAATAALMAKFYHEMWVNKKPPIEALREAQLTIYRRPDLIPALAAERGLKLEEALNAKSAPPAEAKGTTPTKLWAAFVLSGVGK